MPAVRSLDRRTHAHARVRIPRRAGGGAPHPPFAPRANRSAARAGARAFRGVNGPLPTRAALRFSRAGPFHLLHGALAPALVRGAIGLARRKADAGQESLPRRLQRRGMNSHERLPRNWSRGWARPGATGHGRSRFDGRRPRTTVFTDGCRTRRNGIAAPLGRAAVTAWSRARSSF